jgi:triphosphatase
MPSRNAGQIEWQFDAVDLRAVQRRLEEPTDLQIDSARNESHVDLYLDTHDRRFHRAGYSLRIRRAARARRAETTLAALDETAELTEQLADAEPATLLAASNGVGERVRAVAGKQPLLILFEVRTRRRLLTLQVDGVERAAIVLDTTTIRSAEHSSPTHIRRVEIELLEDALPVVGPFVAHLEAACGLQPAGLSKYDAGLLSADLRPPRAETFGETVVAPDAAIGDVALAVLRRNFAEMVAKEPSTRLGDDIEALHDMRVATRRLRAALSLFADVLPPGAPRFREELGWVADALGGVRDLDVQLEQLDGWMSEVPDVDRVALSSLRALLAEERSEARAAMLEALDSRRYEVLVGRFGRWLRARRRLGSGPAGVPARAVAPDLLEGSYDRLRARAERIDSGSEPSELHRLRIRGKRFRYALEFLVDVYPGHMRPLIKRMVVLQDVLGRHQDADVAIGRLRELAARTDGGLEPATIFAMGELAERYRQSREAVRAEFPAAYARVRGKAWKSLRRQLEDQRPATPEASPPSLPAPSGSP